MRLLSQSHQIHLFNSVNFSIIKLLLFWFSLLDLIISSFITFKKSISHLLSSSFSICHNMIEVNNPAIEVQKAVFNPSIKVGTLE